MTAQGLTKVPVAKTQLKLFRGKSLEEDFNAWQPPEHFIRVETAQLSANGAVLAVFYSIAEYYQIVDQNGIVVKVETPSGLEIANEG